MSDDQHTICAKKDILIEGGCKGKIYALITTMEAGASQTLSVTGGSEYDDYYWAASTGSLSSNEGMSVVYTAPATNPNCANNPTITLTCGGAQVDSISIAINAINAYAVGYVTEVVSIGYCTIEYYPPGVINRYFWNEMKVKCYALQCNGTVTLSSYNDNIGGLCPAKQDPSCSCAKAYEFAVWHTGICQCGGTEAIEGKFSDCRSSYLKTNGCCPIQLMSNTRTCPLCY